MPDGGKFASPAIFYGGYTMSQRVTTPTQYNIPLPLSIDRAFKLRRHHASSVQCRPPMRSAKHPHSLICRILPSNSGRYSPIVCLARSVS